MPTCEGQKAPYESWFSLSCHVGPGNQTQVTRFGGQCSNLRSHLTDPRFKKKKELQLKFNYVLFLHFQLN